MWITDTIDESVQMNDLELASDGLVLAGHKYSQTTEGCWFDGCGVIKGHAIKLDQTGEKVWAKDYGNYPGGVNQFDGLE